MIILTVIPALCASSIALTTSGRGGSRMANMQTMDKKGVRFCGGGEG